MELKVVQVEYIRDYSNPTDKRLLVKKGHEQLRIEQFVLRFFEKQGYSGFQAENEFWEIIGRLLFLDELLTTYQYKGKTRYGLSGVKEVKNRVEKQEYTHRLIEFGMSNLTKFIGDNAKRYTELPLYFTVEKEFRDSGRMSEYLHWFDVVVEIFKLNVLIPLFDWIFTNPFPGQSLTGMPDLLLFKDKKPAFAEVKSENDRLSSIQQSTLKFLTTDLGIETYLVDGKEKLSAIDSAQKNKFLEYRHQESKKKRELKKEIEGIVGHKITRKTTYLDLDYRGDINLSPYIRLIRCFHELGYHWISIPLFKGLPSKIIFVTEDFEKLNLDEVRELGILLKIDKKIIQDVICKCKKHINTK